MQGLSIHNPVMDELVAVANDILNLKKRHTIVVAQFSALLRKANSSTATTGAQAPEAATPSRPKPRARKAVKPTAAGPKAIEAEPSKPKAPKPRVKPLTVETPRTGSEPEVVATMLDEFDLNVAKTLKKLGVVADQPDYDAKLVHAMLVAGESVGWKRRFKKLSKEDKRLIWEPIKQQIEELSGKTFAEAAAEYRLSKEAK